MAITARCSDCGFESEDIPLVQNHDCDTLTRGYCEDYPACGHEAGDCSGLKYGSDEKIKADVYRAMRDPDYEWAMERQAEYDEMWG